MHINHRYDVYCFVVLQLVGIATTVAASIVAITSISEVSLLPSSALRVSHWLYPEVLDAVKARGSKAEKNIWKAGFPAVAMDVFGVWCDTALHAHWVGGSLAAHVMAISWVHHGIPHVCWHLAL